MGCGARSLSLPLEVSFPARIIPASSIADRNRRGSFNRAASTSTATLRWPWKNRVAKNSKSMLGNTSGQRSSVRASGGGDAAQRCADRDAAPGQETWSRDGRNSSERVSTHPESAAHKMATMLQDLQCGAGTKYTRRSIRPRGATKKACGLPPYCGRLADRG